MTFQASWSRRLQACLYRKACQLTSGHAQVLVVSDAHHRHVLPGLTRLSALQELRYLSLHKVLRLPASLTPALLPSFSQAPETVAHGVNDTSCHVVPCRVQK